MHPSPLNNSGVGGHSSGVKFDVQLGHPGDGDRVEIVSVDQTKMGEVQVVTIYAL
jgi:hypothetical protein